MDEIVQAQKELRDDVDLLKKQMARMVEMMEAMNTLIKAKAVETITPENFVQGAVSYPLGVGVAPANVQKFSAQGRVLSTTTYHPHSHTIQPNPPYGLPHNYTPPIATNLPITNTSIPIITTSNPIQSQIHAPELPQPQLASELQAPHFAVTDSSLASDAKARLESLEERLRAIEGGNGHGFGDALGLCLVPDVVISPKFKAPEFERYKGSSCPKIHLKMYYRKMGAYTRNEKLLIHCFQESLTGAAMNWYTNLEPSRIRSWRDLAEAFMKQYQYNSDLAPDRLQLQSLSKRSDESFRSYAQRWRELAAQVEPPMLEKEMCLMFLDTLTYPFYDKMVGYVYANFTDIVSAGERIDQGFEKGRFGQGSIEEEVYGDSSEGEEAEIQVVSDQERDYHPSTPHLQPPQFPHLSYPYANTIPLPYYQPYLPQTVPPIPTQYIGQPNIPAAKPKSSAKKEKIYDHIPGTYSELLSQLLQSGLIDLCPSKPRQPPFPVWFNPNAKCAYHEGVIGHTTEDCNALKLKVQDLIDKKRISFKAQDSSSE